jgi:hypothetical protein
MTDVTDSSIGVLTTSVSLVTLAQTLQITGFEKENNPITITPLLGGLSFFT